MERIRENRTKGLNRNGLRTWAMLIAVAGLVGRGLLQNRIMGMTTITNEELLALLNGSSDMMVLATVSLVLQMVETCGVPMFALLLAEGFIHTSNYRNYVLRVAGCAIVSEIPYDLLMSGSFIDLSRQNPVFGMVLGLVVLYFFRSYEGKGIVKVLIRVLVVILAMVWSNMLGIDMGSPVVLLVWPMYVFRNKPMYRNLMAASMAIVCTLFSMFFVMAPMGCLMLHMYNGEKGEAEPNKVVTYLAYPAVILVLALGAMFLI